MREPRDHPGAQVASQRDPRELGANGPRDGQPHIGGNVPGVRWWMDAKPMRHDECRRSHEKSESSLRATTRTSRPIKAALPQPGGGRIGKTDLNVSREQAAAVEPFLAQGFE